MCELCRAEVGDEIYNGIEQFLRDWPDAEYGPAHIVLSDCNIGPDWHIRWCLGLIAAEQQRRGLRAENPYADVLDHQDITMFCEGFHADCDTNELAATEMFLRDWLLPRAIARCEREQ
jgi:hypothetical protein